MTLWRVEWLRIWRTRTVWILFGIFIFFGVLGPLTAQFLPEIVKRAGVAGEIDLPPTSPELAMSQYVGNALQIGILAIAFIAATALAFDSKPEIAVFYRTRATITEILTPGTSSSPARLLPPLFLEPSSRSLYQQHSSGHPTPLRHSRVPH